MHEQKICIPFANADNLYYLQHITYVTLFTVY